jgi:hypothetical protein
MENMKAGEGSPEWLRLFALMSAEFAVAEKCPEPPGLPERSARVREIRDLEKQLEAVSTLEHITHVVKYTEHLDPRSTPEYYQIIYDRKKRIVNVEPYFNAIAGARAYEKTEVDAEQSQSGRRSDYAPKLTAAHAEGSRVRPAWLEPPATDAHSCDGAQRWLAVVFRGDYVGPGRGARSNARPEGARTRALRGRQPAK